MMTDYSIFAVVVPCPYTTAEVFRRWNPNCYNSNRAVEVLTRTDTQSHCYNYPDSDKFPELTMSGCIILYLNQLPKNAAKGWTFGQDQKTCDVCLGIGTSKLSLEHFRIQMDDQHRIWLHEQSSNGTVIKYGQHETGSRRLEPMFLHSAGRRFQENWPTIKITVDGLRFWIYFPNHNSKHPDYLANLQRYHAATLEALPPLHGLGLASRVPTMQPTEVIPSGRLVPPFMFPIEILQLTERSKVTKVFNTREAYVCVQKEFFHRVGSLHDSRGHSQEKWMATICEQVAIMQRFSHPNIAPVLGFWEAPIPTLVMPCYKHGDLQHFYEDRRRAPLGVAKVRDLMRQLLSAVAQIHASGAVHRDLKASNVAIESLEGPFTVVVLDFDLASANPNGVMQSHCGTECYVAPEILSAKGSYGPKIDIWSLGIVFLEAIRPMFMASLQRTVGYKLYTRAVENELQLLKRNKDFSKVEKDIIRGMLYVTPARRLTAARCLELCCESGLFRKSELGDFIYEAGDAVPVDIAEPVNGQLLATIDEHVRDDGVAETAAQARSCYNIPSEATTHQASGDTTPRATGGSTSLAHRSSVWDARGAPVEENEDVSEYFPAASGSRAPMHHLWSEVSQRREPSQTSVIEEAASATHDASQGLSTVDDDSGFVVCNTEIKDDPVKATIDSLPAAPSVETTAVYTAKRNHEPAAIHCRSDPAEDPRVIAILNDLRAHKVKTTPNWKRRAPEDDAQHILETQVVPAKKIKSSPLYPSWYNGLWTPEKGVTKW